VHAFFPPLLEFEHLVPDPFSLPFCCVGVDGRIPFLFFSPRCPCAQDWHVLSFSAPICGHCDKCIGRRYHHLVTLPPPQARIGTGSSLFPFFSPVMCSSDNKLQKTAAKPLLTPNPRRHFFPPLSWVKRNHSTASLSFSPT